MKLDPVMVEYVRPERIKTITIGKTVAYISDKTNWTYKFVKNDGKWELDKILMKRRYGNGRYKTSTRRHDERKRNNRRSYY